MRTFGTGITHPGHKRELNEDALLVRNESGLYIVADGMGGHASGEVASATAIEATLQALDARRDLLDAAREGKEHILAAAHAVEEAVQAACAEVWHKARQEQGRHGMGTTLTVVQILGFKAVMGHVGDSRLYMQRNGRIEQMSQDHSMIAEFIRAGVLTPETARRSPYQHVLTRALGTQPSVQVDTLIFDIFPGDRLVLCSDGLGDYLPEPATLRPLLDGEGSVAAEELLKHALAQGGEDNITALVVDVEAESGVEPAHLSATELMRRFEAMEKVLLFTELGISDLQRVLNACVVQPFNDGQILLDEGAPGDGMIIVLQGEVQVKVGEHDIGALVPGEAIGETLLLSPRPSPATLTARGEVQVLTLRAAAFHELARHRPRLGIRLLRRLGERAVVAFQRAHTLLREANVGHNTVWPHPGDLC